MIVLGLTGSIGMGKSTTAAMFARAGCPVWDADAAVHALYAGPAAPAIEAAFPGTARDGAVDRERLSRAVVGSSEALTRLEAIVHPLVRASERDFLARAAMTCVRFAVLEIPLLFETGGEHRCDAVAVVTADAAVQRQRVLARAAMTPAKLDALLARQLPDREKRRRAHFLIDTGRGLAYAEGEVAAVMRALAPCPGGRAAFRRKTGPI